MRSSWDRQSVAHLGEQHDAPVRFRQDPRMVAHRFYLHSSAEARRKDALSGI